MSWISENYEKAAVGGAVLAAVGFAYFGWSKFSSVENDFGSTPKGEPSVSDPGVKSADMVAKTKSSFQLKRDWLKSEDKGRAVDLFTGVALFVNKNDPNKPVDLIKDEPVHPNIPNVWWLDYGIDPGFGDSPLRDEDDDGFSNAEEHAAKTDPSNNEEYPSLVTKLTYINAESVQWVLRPVEAEGGSFTFKWGNGKLSNRVGAADPVLPGEIFFKNEPVMGRFKLLSSEKRRVMNEAIQAEEEVIFVMIEDQKPNKKGIIYEIPAGFRTANMRKYAKFDQTAVLSLEALGFAGQEIRVDENTAFALPPGDTKKIYMMKEVTPERIVIEFTSKDGKVQSHEIRKGETGPAVP